jgi:hypothetical protein
MALTSIAFKSGATLPLTGGTTDPIMSGGQSFDKSLLLFTDDVSQQTQRTAEFSVKRSKVSSNSPDGSTQARRSIVMKFPKLLANGSYTVNTVRLELSASVESVAADISEMRLYMASAIIDSEATDFFNSLTTE